MLRIAKKILIVPALIILSSCNYTPQVNGELRSDGFMQYFFKGKKVIYLDSTTVSDPSINLLSGSYSKRDSVLTLQARSWPNPYTDALLLHINHCFDTGFYLLASTDNSYAEVTENGVWSTDLSHTGEVHLIALDTIRNIVQGTFRFSGKSINSSNVDSVVIDSGKIFNFPITIAR
jgi:hypothetical protein